MDLNNILSTLQPFLVMFVALFAAFLTATWVSCVIWAFRDIRARSRDIFAQILATLMVLIFFPLFPLPGLVLYLILRPRETLSEIYERTLEEEALLHGIEERLACPGCNRRADEDYVICPACHTRLKKSCTECGRLLHLRWTICPYCGASQAQPVAAPPAGPAASDEEWPVFEEPAPSDEEWPAFEEPAPSDADWPAPEERVEVEAEPSPGAAESRNEVEPRLPPTDGS